MGASRPTQKNCALGTTETLTRQLLAGRAAFVVTVCVHVLSFMTVSNTATVLFLDNELCLCLASATIQFAKVARSS